jgi:hypothetical protein
MRSKRISSGLLLCVLILLVGAEEVYSIRKHPLQLKLSKGKKYYFHTTNDLKVTQTMGQRITKTNQKLEVGMIMDINSVDSASTMVVDCNYALLKVVLGSGKRQLVYDSSKKGPVPKAAQIFSKLLGEKFSMHITPLGKVKKFGGLKEMRERVAKKLPAGSTTQGLEKYLDAADMRQWLEGMLAIYPGKIVDVNDTWKRETATLRRYPIMTEDTFRVKGSKRRTVTIEVKSKIKPNVDAKPSSMAFAMIGYEFNGTQEGLIEVKETSGLIKKSILKKKASGLMKMSITMGGDKPNEVGTPLEFEELVTVAMSRMEEPDEDDLEEAAKKKAAAKEKKK